MNDTSAFALFAAPLLLLVLALILEFRRDRASLRSPRRMVPLAVSVLSSLLLLLAFILEPGLPYKLFLLNWNLFADVMATVSLLAVLSALFGRYKSRAAIVLILTGGFASAILWSLTLWKPGVLGVLVC